MRVFIKQILSETKYENRTPVELQPFCVCSVTSCSRFISVRNLFFPETAEILIFKPIRRLMHTLQLRIV